MEEETHDEEEDPHPQLLAPARKADGCIGVCSPYVEDVSAPLQPGGEISPERRAGGSQLLILLVVFLGVHARVEKGRVDDVLVSVDAVIMTSAYRSHHV